MGNKEQTFQKIIEIAYVMFAENGFEKTSLAMIATEVGISNHHLLLFSIKRSINRLHI